MPASAAAPPSAPPSAPNGSLRVHYLSVGQGDATVWELPGGGVVVYDCGPRVGVGEENPVVAFLAERLSVARGARVHALVASHGHLDHVGGCAGVFEAFEIGHVYDAWFDGADVPASYASFRDAARMEGAVLHTPAPSGSLDGERVFARGDVLDLPEAARAAGVRAQILWPGEAASSWDAIAERSLVVRLSLGEASWCFQGDIEAAQERAIASSAPGEIACDAVLVGHHGSRSASSAEWLAALSPSIAVVSFGENSFGHPTSEALCRVQQAGARVFATHRLGTVTVESDGVAPLVALPAGAETLDYCAPGASYWP